MHNRTLSLTIFAAMFALAVVPATAGVLAYGTLSDWQAAGSQTGNMTFEGVAQGNLGTSYTSGPLTFSAATGFSLTVYNTIYGPGSGNFLTSPSPLIIAADPTVYGLGFNFSCYSCGGQTATILVTNSAGVTTQFSVDTMSTSNANFFGVRSDLSIQNLQISFAGSTPFVAVDNVVSGPNDTPEAATFILIGTGLGLIARYRRYISLPSAV